MRRDCETGEKVINPYIEVGRAGNNELNTLCSINATTFKAVSGDIGVMPSSGSNSIAYEVFAVVGAALREDGDYSGVNPAKPALVRIRLGYLEDSVLKEKLPKTYAELNPDEESDAERNDFMLDSQEVGDLVD